MEANREREKRILRGTNKKALPSSSDPDDGAHDATISELRNFIRVFYCNLQRINILCVAMHQVGSRNDSANFFSPGQYDHSLPN
jgi:hypothetical protein